MLPLLKIYMGDKAARFMKNLYSLNKDGLRRLREYSDELALIEKYQKEEP